MKGYLLDTSICVFLLRGKRSVEERLNEINEDECYITDAVVAELLFGAYYSDRVEDNLRQVENFVSEMKVIPFHETVHAFAQERTTLWKAGKKIDDFDLLIGSAAKAKDLVVVTHNRKHFENIAPGFFRGSPPQTIHSCVSKGLDLSVCQKCCTFAPYSIKV